MEQEESASLGAPGTQEDDRARALAWAARTPGIPDPDNGDPVLPNGAFGDTGALYESLNQQSQSGSWG